MKSNVGATSALTLLSYRQGLRAVGGSGVVVGGGAGPSEMTRSTPLPACAPAPAAGFWLITRPAATVLLLTAETSSKTNPAAINVALAATVALPTTLGIFGSGGGTTAGPSETTSATGVPAC